MAAAFFERRARGIRTDREHHHDKMSGADRETDTRNTLYRYHHDDSIRHTHKKMIKRRNAEEDDSQTRSTFRTPDRIQRRRCCRSTVMALLPIDRYPHAAFRPTLRRRTTMALIAALVVIVLFQSVDAWTPSLPPRRSARAPIATFRPSCPTTTRTFLRTLPLFASSPRRNKRDDEGDEEFTSEVKETIVEDDDNDDDEDIDFPRWVRGLRQWPLYPAEEQEDEARGGAAKDKAKDSVKNTKRSNDVKAKSSSAPKPSLAEKENAARMDLETTDTATTNVPPKSVSSSSPPILNLEALLTFALRNNNKTAASAKQKEGVSTTLASSDDKDDNSNLAITKNTTSLTNASTLATAAAAESATSQEASAGSTLGRLEELSAWGEWVGGLRQSLGDLRKQASSRAAFTLSAEGLLKQATMSIETLVNEAASPSTIAALVKRATETVENSTVAADLVESAKLMAVERGLDVTEAAERAKDTTAYAANIATVAAGVLGEGYVLGDPLAERTEQKELLQQVKPVQGSQALFADYATAVEMNELDAGIVKAAEMGYLSGAIYEETLPRTRASGHSIVARGCTEDVYWMVTDSVANASAFQEASVRRRKQDEPILVRTITIRGFDASDETVDRELLLNRVCTATPTTELKEGVVVHSGLLVIAKAMYAEIKQFADWTAPSHRIVMNGHSIGGSISLLLLFLMTMDRGAEFVQKRVAKVYTFGCPPIAALDNDDDGDDTPTRRPVERCEVLDFFELPTSLVQAYVQPWDPIVRLFTDIDSLYPLVSDLGADGNTPFANGPPRTLRPVTKAILEAWEGWPRFRENYKGTCSQNYTSVGIQHVLLADPTRYLADRFVAVTIPVPPVQTILRISSQELLPALASGFPLDVFEISFVPQAIRSFVHHFYPAYGMPLVDYAKLLERRAQGLEPTGSSFLQNDDDDDNGSTKESRPDWRAAGQWLQRPKLDAVLTANSNNKQERVNRVP